MRILITMIWLFPILFMLHDFEEILMINAWQKRNTLYTESRKNKYIPYNFKASTASIALGVALEFAIISSLTIISFLQNSYIAWFGLFGAFVLHLIFHIFQYFNFKRYVPGVTTSIIFIPLCFYIIYKIKTGILLHSSILSLALSVIIGLIVLIVIVKILHVAVESFSNWIERYSVSS